MCGSSSEVYMASWPSFEMEFLQGDGSSSKVEKGWPTISRRVTQIVEIVRLLP